MSPPRFTYVLLFALMRLPCHLMSGLIINSVVIAVDLRLVEERHLLEERREQGTVAQPELLPQQVVILERTLH
jgi:hypothetical protein